MHRHGINIPLKKREIIGRCRFTCITARYWLIVTQQLTAHWLIQTNKHVNVGCV